MSGDRQDQRVGEGGQAIQAGNDVIIYQGVSPTQIAEILSISAKMIDEYKLQAREEVEKRFHQFEEKIQSKFADKEDADPEAFKDPDFQYVVREAQNSYIRSGDENTCDALVSLLAQRSLIKDRNLLSLILNEAVETAGKVARPELSVMTMGFLLYNSSFLSKDIDELINQMRVNFSPFIGDIPKGDSSYGYLSGLGCIEINELVGRSLHDVLVGNYGGIFNNGFTRAEFESTLGEKAENSFIWRNFVLPSRIQNMVFTNIGFENGAPITATPDPNKVYKFNFSNSTELANFFTKNGVDERKRNLSVGLLNRKIWEKDYLASRLRRDIPNIDELYAAFDGTKFPKFNLTAKGIAIAHSNLVQAVPVFKASLSIWIK